MDILQLLAAMPQFKEAGTRMSAQFTELVATLKSMDEKLSKVIENQEAEIRLLKDIAGGGE